MQYYLDVEEATMLLDMDYYPEQTCAEPRCYIKAGEYSFHYGCLQTFGCEDAPKYGLKPDQCIPAPHISDVSKWLWDEHRIMFSLLSQDGGGIRVKTLQHKYSRSPSWRRLFFSEDVFSSPEDAIMHAIKQLLHEGRQYLIRADP